MIPGASLGIERLASRIAEDLAPKATDAYMATDLVYVSGLLALIGQDYERAVDVLMSEHEALQELLAEGRRHISDPALAARLDAVAAKSAASLRISDLNHRAGFTVGALIDLHAAVEVAEEEGEAWASPLNLMIWTFLETFVANRAYSGVFGDPPVQPDPS